TGVEVALDASGEEADAPARPPSRRHDLGKPSGGGNVLEQRVHRGQPREPPGDGGRAHEGAETGSLVELEERQRRAQTGGPGKEREDEGLEHAVLRGRAALTRRGSPRGASRTGLPKGTRFRTPGSPGRGRDAPGELGSALSCPRRPLASGRCGRAASPSPRRARDRSGTGAGRY